MLRIGLVSDIEEVSDDGLLNLKKKESESSAVLVSGTIGSHDRVVVGN